MTPLPQPPRISPGTYVRLRREHLGLTLENVASMLETTPGVSSRRRAEWLGLIEQDVAPISLCTAWALHDTIGIDMRVLSYWMALTEGARPSLFDLLHGSPAIVAEQIWIGVDPADPARDSTS